MSEVNGGHATDDTQKFTEAVAIANIPTLLMVLVQLTGDLQWLDDQYRTRRTRGMNDNDTGGLPEPLQARVRAAALDAILAWRAGRPIAHSRTLAGTAAQNAQLGDGRKHSRRIRPHHCSRAFP